MAFGVHALILCFVVYSQFWPRLWGWEKTTGVRRHANKMSLSLIWGGILAVIVAISIVIAEGNAPADADGTKWGWIDVIYTVSWIKLLLTFSKYVPQVLSNFIRKSTKGWSIQQQLLDFSGSVLSLLQLLLDCSLQADWTGLTGNPIKLGLSFISLAFDVTFILQHYVLYGPVKERGGTDDGLMSVPNASDRESEPLLEDRQSHSGV